jgi:NADH dehydrogenase/NADH:ubiquinone oxidoreductase subunit G
MLMGNVNVNIDGRKLKVREGSTILEAATANGITIPTLCHIQGQIPSGGCRVCVVEVAGSRTLMGACHTPVSAGMVVQTATPAVIAARRVIVELMLTGHTGDCVNDANAENCFLHNLASDYEVGAPRFNVKAPRFYPAEEGNPYVKRNLSKCILCRKCVRACRDMAGKNILSIGYRGFKSKVVTGYDEALTAEVCRDCGICLEHCPTGALSAGPKLEAKAGGKTK